MSGHVWTRVPVVHLVVDIGELEVRPSNVIPGFTERLLELIPTLHVHTCSRGQAGGFVDLLREGTQVSHVLEHVAIELHCHTGADVSRGKTRGASEPGVYDVIYQYRQEEVGVAAGKLACPHPVEYLCGMLTTPWLPLLGSATPSS